MLTKARLLAAIKRKGFEVEPDKATAEQVKAFIAEKGLQFEDADGKDVDVDAVFAADAKVERITLADDAETVSVSRKELDGLKAQIKAGNDAGRGTKAHVLNANDGAEHTPKTFSIGNTARKSYEAKIKTYGVGPGKFQAKFADADVAEICASLVRLSVAGEKHYAQKANDIACVKAGQVEFQNTLGGYLVPPEFVAQLMYVTEPHGIARRLANVVRMSREIQNHPRKTGIASFAWVGEGQATTAQTNNYDSVPLSAKKMQLIMQASNELLEDAAISVADDIANSVGEAYDNTVDDAYLLGDGTSTYGGYVGLNNALPAGAYINGAGAWSAFTLANFNVVMGSIQNIDPKRVVAIGSRQFYHQVIQRLNLASSQFKEIAGPPGMGSTTMSVCGVPYYEWQRMPTATGSTVKSFYIGDFAGASMIGERRDLNIMASEHSAFSSDSIQWRATARAAINIHGDGRGTTVGPIACLVATA